MCFDLVFLSVHTSPVKYLFPEVEKETDRVLRRVIMVPCSWKG